MQEVDLPPGETLIGRSLDCQITLEDPLVSRVHARVIVTGDEAVVEDLGSRNGVKVNGAALRGPTRLKDGDRLRIGTQEVVVTRIEPTAVARHARATGVLRVCANCKLPYPRELLACPNCEATEQEDEETLSASLTTGAQQAWGIQLLVEALERALALGRHEDAERILRRASVQVEEQLDKGMRLDPKQLDGVGTAAVRVSQELGDPTWAVWALRMLRAQRVFPSSAVVERVEAMTRTLGGQLAREMEELASELRTVDRPLSSEEAESLARLTQLATSGAADRTTELGVSS